MILAIVVLNILTNVAGGNAPLRPVLHARRLVRRSCFSRQSAPQEFPASVFRRNGHGNICSDHRGTALGRGLGAARQPSRIKLTEPARRPVAWRWRSEAWQLVLLAIFPELLRDVGILVAAPFLLSAELAVFGLCLKLALLAAYFVQIGQQMVVPDMSDARMPETRHASAAPWRSIGVPTVITLFGMAVIAWRVNRSVTIGPNSHRAAPPC